MEWIDGVPITDLPALEKAGHDLRPLATRLIRLFLTHALRDGFFHADMHQGNLLVAPDGTLVGIDFGITGRIDETERRFLAEILHGFITRDYRRVAQIHFDANYVPPHHMRDAFAQALRAIGEPIHDRNADLISMAELLTLLFDVTRRFDMATQPQLLLLQKTMVTVEGVARTLDPQLNIWQAAAPIVSDWLEKQVGPPAILRDVAENARDAMDAFKKLPDTLAKIERGVDALDVMAQAANRPRPRFGRFAALAVALAALAAALAVWTQ